MGGRRRKPALGGGLESLFGPEDPLEENDGSGQENPGRVKRTLNGRGETGFPGARMIVMVLVAFFLGGAVEFLLSEVRSRVGVGPPSATADAFPPSPLSLPPGPSASDSGPKEPAVPGKDFPESSAAGFTPPPPPQAFHDTAVRQAIHRRFPSSPEDIRLLKEAVKRTQKAVHGPAPEGRAVSVSVSLDPGAQFPVIHLVPGIASTITVVDATGAPWPIEDVIVGNAKSFFVRRMSATNGVVVEPQNDVGWTSLSLVLRGRDTPAVLKLVDSDTLSDTRVTARIEGRGPNAATPLFREPKPVISSRVLAFLDGIPPSEARAVPVHGTEDMEAWRDGDRLFVRTHLDVLAPAWIETVSGPNGMKLYVFSPVSVITAAGEDGQMITVELGEGVSDVRKG